MNNHTIIGVIASEIQLKESQNGHTYLQMWVQDNTPYNNDEKNKYNNYKIIKYGKTESLQSLIDGLSIGMVVYISGTGLYNQYKRYNVIADTIEHVEIIKAEVVEKAQMGLYERLYKEGMMENEES